MIHNQVHRTLLEATDGQDFDDDILILYLSQFIENEEMGKKFEAYIAEQMSELEKTREGDDV